MSSEVCWVPTEHAVYAAIYAVHYADLCVHATHTCSNGGCEFHGQGHVLTQWGFKNADVPLIRSIAEGDWDRESQERDPRRWSYWIAEVKEAGGE